MKLKVPANPKQQLAWQAWLDPVIDDIVYGGQAGGGKSMLGAQVLTGFALRYPETKYFIGREELKNLMLSTYITLTQKVFPQYQLEQDKDWYLDGKYNVVHFRNGSSINLLDLKAIPTDPLFDRFGSHEYTSGWLEEASEISFRAYDVLKSRVGRWKNTDYGIKDKLLLTLNASEHWPYRLFYDPWKKAGRPLDIQNPLVSMESFDAEGKQVKRMFVFIPATYGDNPYTKDQYAKNLATIQDSVIKARLMFGDWEYQSASDALFPTAVISNLFTNSVPFSNDVYLTVDVARMGGNKIVRTLWRGWDAVRIATKTNVPLTTTADDVRTDMETYGIPHEHVLFDEDGVGGGLGDLVPGIIGFHGGAAPFGKVGEQKKRENYQNLRAQCIYHLSYKAQNRAVRVSEANHVIREELAQEMQQVKRRDPEKEGVLKVTQKDEIKENLGRSPDIFDTLMMRSYFDLRIREPQFQTNGYVTVHIPHDIV